MPKHVLYDYIYFIITFKNKEVKLPTKLRPNQSSSTTFWVMTHQLRIPTPTADTLLHSVETLLQRTSDCPQKENFKCSNNKQLAIESMTNI